MADTGYLYKSCFREYNNNIPWRNLSVGSGSRERAENYNTDYSIKTTTKHILMFFLE